MHCKCNIFSLTSGDFNICIKQFCGSFISFYETVLRKLHLKVIKFFLLPLHYFNKKHIFEEHKEEETAQATALPEHQFLLKDHFKQTQLNN